MTNVLDISVGQELYPFCDMAVGDIFTAPVEPGVIRNAARSFARFREGFEVQVNTVPRLGLSVCVRTA
jgi:hypothetical protein